MRQLIIAILSVLVVFPVWSRSEEDPYAVTPATATPILTAPAVDSIKTVVVQDSVKAVPDTVKASPRPRVVRETTVNTLDAMKGRYRSPKKALFMSLIVPGLGQAYTGGTFNYARAAGYLGVDVTMGLLWHQFSVVKYDRQVTRYRRFADEHWRQERYEDQISNAGYLNITQFALANPFREAYCEAVQERASAQGNSYFGACKDTEDPAVDAQALSNFQAANRDLSLTADSVHVRRAKTFPNLFYFYELIGKEQEFVTGWDDVMNTGGADSVVAGTSLNRNQYIDMRATANRYARMQAWFLGGMVLNHIVSALDAALAARSHNKMLYQTETSWYDRVRLDGGLAFEQGWPRANLLAALSF